MDDLQQIREQFFAATRKYLLITEIALRAPQSANCKPLQHPPVTRGTPHSGRFTD